jgi:ABC-type phosphate/phosphonate transport system substrate-binding protein
MKKVIIAVAVVIALDPSTGKAEDNQVCRIGIAKSAVREVPQDLLPFAGDSLQELMKIRTGLNGKVTLDHEWTALVRNLNEGKLDFAVLQGHEYAWAKQKYPDLQPLVCSIERPKEVMAYLLARHDYKAATLADLKGSKLVLATTLKDHARLFLDKTQAVEMGGESFRSIAKVDTVHEAIHKVIAEEYDLTVSDHAAWNYFQKLYPRIKT